MQKIRTRLVGRHIRSTNSRFGCIFLSVCANKGNKLKNIAIQLSKGVVVATPTIKHGQSL